MSNDVELIINKDLLPLKGFSYGKFKASNSRADAYLVAGPLKCKFEPESSQLNLKREIIKNNNEIEKLEVSFRTLLSKEKEKEYAKNHLFSLKREMIKN